MAQDLTNTLRHYGARKEWIRDLRGTPSVELLPYLDLMLRVRATGRLTPDAVIEVGDHPLAYALDARTSGATSELPLVRRSLAYRADAPFLVLVEPGKLTVYGLTLQDVVAHRGPIFSVSSSEESAGSALRRLTTYPFPGMSEADARAVEDQLYKLLTDTVKAIIDARVERNDAISLVGRALFARFLVDRLILTEDSWADVASRAEKPEQFFATAENAAATCKWLDETFNGDLLPLSFRITKHSFGSLDPSVLRALSSIMLRKSDIQLSMSFGPSWGDFDFAHVPVGLLSQVYERESEYWNPAKRHDTSVYYTPRRIAEYMVREVLANAASSRKNVHDLRVLDPAVGGGVFLVAAFRELVASWWRANGRAPRTSELRTILYKQLAGFDISEPALRLAALSLYLTALELDLDPRPLDALGFKPLRGKVLFNVRDDENDARVLGSLSEAADSGHLGRYDIVIGNPPWTALEKETAAAADHVIGKIVSERSDIEARDFHLPDGNPDIAFVWKATQWAKSDGWIAFALHARLLFRTSEKGRGARIQLFDAIEVTGVLNGAAMRNTLVWPEVAAPFCVLFARNRKPTDESAFYFVSPVQEPQNDDGRMRVDYASAQPVALSYLRASPDVLKTLFRGTALDVAALNRVRSSSAVEIASYWKNHRLQTGQGYQIGTSEEQDASELHGLPDLAGQIPDRVLTDVAHLQPFNRARLHRWRRRAIYRAPLVLVKKSPPAAPNTVRASCAFSDIAYHEQLFGYSTHGHADAEGLAKYVALLVNSDFFLWYLLMTSGEFGVERESLHKLDIDRFPIIPFEVVPDSLRARIPTLFDSLAAEEADASARVTAWACDVYGLPESDREVIVDTLSVALPFRASITRAQAHPTEEEKQAFATMLRDILTPFSAAVGRPLEVSLVPPDAESQWDAFIVSAGRVPLTEQITSKHLDRVLKKADETGASLVVLPLKDQPALIAAVLGQYRYWTKTRARICGLDFLQEHLDVFNLNGAND